MKTVRIGITCGLTQTQRAAFNHLDIGYTKALLAQGALPLVLPIFKEEALIAKALDQVEGLLISGGADLSPLLYGEHLMKASYRYYASRDRADILYYQEAVRRKMPILGICRGLQLINIAEGGSLYQDIPTQLKTDILHGENPKYPDMEHRITVRKDSELFDILGSEELIVNSVHHQAIKELGRNLRVTAEAPDGIIEAVEGTRENWLLAVQFHPERIYEREDMSAIFRRFLERAGREA